MEFIIEQLNKQSDKTKIFVRFSDIGNKKTIIWARIDKNNELTGTELQDFLEKHYNCEVELWTFVITNYKMTFAYEIIKRN